jgi:hypothetical protein
MILWDVKSLGYNLIYILVKFFQMDIESDPGIYIEINYF